MDITAAILVRLVMILATAYMVFLITAPFLYLKFKKKAFSPRNVILSSIVSVILASFGLYSLYWGLAYWQGLAALDIYGY